MNLPARLGRRCLPPLLLLLPVAASAGTPGEVKNLVVTGRDPRTGDISISYDPACDASDHHIEYGLLQNVGTSDYSGQDCAIGTTGVYGQFNPGSGSYFFIVVGDDGVSVEGSYGLSLTHGVTQERPEDTLDPVCSFIQDLSESCDVVRIEVAETIGVTDAPVAIPPVVLEVRESIGVSDVASVEPSVFVVVTETIGVTDAPVAIPPVVVQVIEPIWVTDAPTVLPQDAPTVLTMTPTPGSVSTERTDRIVVMFSNNLRPDGVAPGHVLLEGSRSGKRMPSHFEFNGTTRELTIAYADPLPQDDYTLTLVSGTPGLGLSDGAVNALDGECPGGSCDSPAELPSGDGEGGGDYVATFSVDTLPHVIGVTPAPDSSGVSKAANVAITFDEPVDPLTVTTRTFLLKDEMGRPVPASVSVGTRDTDAVLDPTSPLDPETTYTVEVTSSVTDITGRQAVAFTSRFRASEATQARTLSEASEETEGLASWSRAGAAVAGAGDLNQDGVSDWLTGAPSHQAVEGLVEAGAVLVYFGSPDPADRSTPDLIFEGAAAHDRAGVAVAGSFDFNGDGKLDILIGAEQVNRTSDDDSIAGCDAGAPCGPGKAYLVYFDPADPVFSSRRLRLADVGVTIPGVVFEGAAPGDQVGFALAGKGPRDGATGRGILIGAPGRDTTEGSDAGTVYEIFGDPAIRGTVDLERVACTRQSPPCPEANEIAGVVYQGAAAGDQLGFSCALVGDVVQSPRAVPAPFEVDIGMGAPGSDSGGEDSGTVYVADTTGIGRSTGWVEVGGIGVSTPGFQIRGSQAGERLGWAIGAGGDSRSDGLPDLLIGAPFNDVGISQDAGRVIHISEAFTAGIYAADDVGVTIGGIVWTGAAEQGNLGRALDGVHDATADGFDDVVLGAPFTDPQVNGTVLEDAGSVYLIEGLPVASRGGRVSVSEIGVSVAGEELVGDRSGEHAGSSIRGADDIDDDGDADFIVGAPLRDSPGGEPDAGRVYLVLPGEPELGGGGALGPKVRIRTRQETRPTERFLMERKLDKSVLENSAKKRPT